MNSEKHLLDDHKYSLDRVYKLMDEWDIPSIWGGKDTDYPEPSEAEIEKIAKLMDYLFPDGITPGTRRSPLIRNATDWLAMSHIHYLNSKACYDKIWRRSSLPLRSGQQVFSCDSNGRRQRIHNWESQCVVAHVYAGLAIELLYKSVWACSPVEIPLPPDKHKIQVVYEKLSSGDKNRIRDIIKSASTRHFSNLAQWHDLVDKRLTSPTVRYFGVNLNADDYADRRLHYDFEDILPDFYLIYDALYKWANPKILFANMSIMDAELYRSQSRTKDVFE